MYKFSVLLRSTESCFDRNCFVFARIYLVQRLRPACSASESFCSDANSARSTGSKQILTIIVSCMPASVQLCSAKLRAGGRTRSLSTGSALTMIVSCLLESRAVIAIR